MFELASMPQEMGDIMLQGLRLGRLTYRRLFSLTSIIAFLGLLPTAFLVWGAGDTEITNDFLFGKFMGPYGAVSFVVIFIGFLVRAVMLRRIAQAARNQAAEPREAELRQAIRVWLWMALAFLVYVLAVTLGMILLIVPGLILALSLMFEEYGVVLEGLGPIQALNASHNLVWGHWWRTLGLFLLMLIPTAFLFAIIAAILHIDLGSMDAAGHGRDLFEQTVLQMVFMAFLGPFFYSILFLYYHDLMLRKQLR